jgi:hypothetical protein
MPRRELRTEAEWCYPVAYPVGYPVALPCINSRAARRWYTKLLFYFIF